jgi:Transposase DDE domain group 1
VFQETISGMASVSYVRQMEPLGLGHAILCARPLVGDEPASAGHCQSRASPRRGVPADGLHRHHADRAAGRFDNRRGTAEQWIKGGRAATHSTRLSCHRFRANEVGLLLGVLADNLGNLLRRLALPVTIQSWSLTSLPPRLVKTGGRLVNTPSTSGSNWPGAT